ncbi:MAG: hypothetical protein EPN47_11280 [Acidobacteria bacterium]|nr:MAG: hypothetical protein EPN47_11280 [Acidobacteriota bacterium]
MPRINWRNGGAIFWIVAALAVLFYGVPSVVGYWKHRQWMLALVDTYLAILGIGWICFMVWVLFRED